MTYHGFFGQDIRIVDETTVIIGRDGTVVLDLGPDLDKAFDAAEAIIDANRDLAYCIQNASPNTIMIYR